MNGGRGDHGGLDIASMLRVRPRLPGGGAGKGIGAKMRQRRLLADLCRLIGNHLAQPDQRQPLDRELSPRMQQTLQSLLTGDSEKQAAAKLGVSRNTVHVYVKQLYRRFGVNSRGELLAKWVRN